MFHLLMTYKNFEVGFASSKHNLNKTLPSVQEFETVSLFITLTLTKPRQMKNVVVLSHGKIVSISAGIKIFSRTVNVVKQLTRCP